MLGRQLTGDAYLDQYKMDTVFGAIERPFMSSLVTHCVIVEFPSAPKNTHFQIVTE